VVLGNFFEFTLKKARNFRYLEKPKCYKLPFTLLPTHFFYAAYLSKLFWIDFPTALKNFPGVFRFKIDIVFCRETITSIYRSPLEATSTVFHSVSIEMNWNCKWRSTDKLKSSLNFDGRNRMQVISRSRQRKVSRYIAFFLKRYWGKPFLLPRFPRKKSKSKIFIDSWD